VCGERMTTSPLSFFLNGSAPRVRGTDGDEPVDRRLVRFSPACAGNGESQCRATTTASVQPRVCGERHKRTEPSGRIVGSAPRVRGTELRASAGAQHRRFSPACAGNGGERQILIDLQAVQPRVCGERVRFICVSDLGRGSAPRVRGTVVFPVEGPDAARFSPACAGNGPIRSALRTLRAVQPRVCGEREIL